MSKRLGDVMEYQNENFDGQYDFRIRLHGGWKMAQNIHEYSEFLYCKRGNGHVTVNGRGIELSEGQLVWIPPNYVHQYHFDDGEQICAVFSNDFIPLFFKELNNKSYRVSAVRMSGFETLFEDFLRVKKNDKLRICGYLNLICSKVMSEAKLDDKKLSDGILYQKIISYISKSYMQDITLSSVAAKFGYNVKYLSHTLHTLTGIDFRRLLNFYRLNHAKSLLEGLGDINISFVAQESGFKSLNTFNREFKKMMGMTPGEYKKLFH